MSGDSHHHHHIASAETSELLSSSSSSQSGDEGGAESLSCVVSIADAVVRYKTPQATGTTLHLDHAFEDTLSHHHHHHHHHHSPPKKATFSHSSMLSRPGPRYLLFTEGEVQLFRCNSRSTVTKLLKTQCARQWESTRLILGSFNMIIYWLGYVEQRVPYCAIGEIEALPHWDTANHKFCIRISMSDALLLIQTNSIRERDQLLHSIRWKTCVSRFWRAFQQTTSRRSHLIYDFKEMIDAAVSSPILDDSILEFPLEVLSSVLDDKTDMVIDRQETEEMFVTIAPLLEISVPSKPMFDFFTKYSNRSDVTPLVLSAFGPVVYKILKHNLEIGRQAKRRMFVQEYIEVMRSQKNGRQSVLTFIKRLHGSGSLCPHQRILPNLVSVCLPVIHRFYEAEKQPTNRRISSCLLNDRLKDENALEEKFITYMFIMQIMCEFADWLPHLARLLQPVPFPTVALQDDLFLTQFSSIILSISDHEACEVHCTVLGVREDRDGWLDHFCPHSGLACRDEGHVYGVMLRRLIGCCCLRRQFVERKTKKMIGAWCSMAETSNRSAIELLVAVLDYKISADAGQTNRQVIDSLHATDLGQKAYRDFCQRQFHLLEIQRKSGPRQLTLASKATDADLSKILNSGSFGNLICLSLAFTNVTSACAMDIVKLPFLQQLNLWSTQFSDVGLELLSEHMDQLEVLNLCETPVTDKGLRCLTALKSLRKLNLNSTQVSALTFEKLKENLPLLQEYDVSYTDAW